MDRVGIHRLFCTLPPMRVRPSQSAGSCRGIPCKALHCSCPTATCSTPVGLNNFRHPERYPALTWALLEFWRHPSPTPFLSAMHHSYWKEHRQTRMPIGQLTAQRNHNNALKLVWEQLQMLSRCLSMVLSKDKMIVWKVYWCGAQRQGLRQMKLSNRRGSSHQSHFAS